MPSLSRESVDFLLKEYEQLMLEIRHMYGYLLKVYGFYITVLGVVIAGAATLLHTEEEIRSPLTLPPFFVVASIVVLVILAATLMLYIAKLRSVATGYVNALNRIRRGFFENDRPIVDPYLDLPIEDFSGSKWRNRGFWWNIDFFSYASVAVLSGLLLAAGSLFVAVSVCSVTVAAVLFVLWGGLWVGIWAIGSKPRPGRHSGRSTS